MQSTIVAINRGSTLKFQLTWPDIVGAVFDVYSPSVALVGKITIDVIDPNAVSIVVRAPWSDSYTVGSHTFWLRAILNGDSETLPFTMVVQ
jgi:hypothetical protein